MVGDDIESDIGGAKRAGLRAVLVGQEVPRDTRRGRAQPDGVVASIADVPAFLGEPA